MRLAVILVLCLPSLFFSALGWEEDLWEAAGGAALEQMAPEQLELTPELTLESGLAELGETFRRSLTEMGRNGTRSAAMMLVIVFFSGLLQTVCRGTDSSKQMAAGVAVLSMTGLAVSDIDSLMELGRETVIQLTEFNQLLIPAMTAAAAAGGGVTGAGGRQMAALMESNLILRLMERLLIPLVYLYLACCAAARVTGNQGLHAIAGFAKWLVKTILAWSLMLFTSYMSLSGVIAGTADRAAVKVTRFAISGMVPVVGGILSDAAESVLNGAALLRNAIGVFGTLAVLYFCLEPFLQLGVRYLMYRLAAVFASVMTDSPVVGLIHEIGSAFGLIMAMTGTAAMLTLISVITTIMTAVT